jgi:phosphotransferase system  glucose/maltose/N-acetylglucosamine-specific IIC component
MDMKKIILVLIGSTLIGILGGLVTRSILVGIGLPILLIIFFVMMFAVKDGKLDEPEEKKKDKEDDTFHRG